jgi:hypothetical protein
MLQILGEAMLIATRSENNLFDPRRDAPRPPRKETEAAKTARRGWFNIAGLLS